MTVMQHNGQQPYRLHWPRDGGPKSMCGLPTTRWENSLTLFASEPSQVTCRSCARSLAEPWHGTWGGYSNHACRCEPCTAASTAKQTVWRDGYKGKRLPAHIHGSENGYCNYSCRCIPCTAAHAEAGRKRRAKAGLTAGERKEAQ